MTLKEYLRKNRINPYEFASANDINRISMWRYLKGHKPSRTVAQKIESITDGKVTVNELRPISDNPEKWW